MSIILKSNINNNMPLFNPLTVEVQEEGTPEGAVNTLNFTGDVDVTVSGNVATVDITGGGGTPPLLPTTGTGTATGAVVGSLDGNTLNVQQGGNFFLNIDPTANAEYAQLRAYNTTGDDNYGQLSLETTSALVSSRLKASFNGEVDEAEIELSAQSGSSSITHTADTHTFVVNTSLTATNNSDVFFRIDPTDNDENVYLAAFNTTANDNVGSFLGQANNTETRFTLTANFNDGTETSSIVGFADATTSTITHTADQNTINGAVRLATLGGNGSGIVAVDNDGDLSFTQFENNNYYIEILQALGSSIKAYSAGVDITSTTGTSVTLGTGQARFNPIWLAQPATLTGAIFYQTVQGDYTANNNNKVGLYSYSGGTMTLVASSANDGELFKAAANTYVTKAFSSTYAAARGLYFLAFIWNRSAVVTAPQIAAGPTMSNAAKSVLPDFTNSAKMFSSVSAITDLPATQAMTGTTAQANSIWMAVY